MIAVQRIESTATEADAHAALAALEHAPGVWLGCDVAAPGLFRREATVALDPLLTFYLDGKLLRVLPHGDLGRGLARSLTALAPFTPVQGRLELALPARAEAPHPVIALLRRFLACFDAPPPELGLYGALAFDYYRLADGDGVADDGRRRMALMLPERVLYTGDAGHRWVTLRFPGVQPLPGAEATIEPQRAERRDDDLPAGGHAAAVARAVEHMRRGEVASLVLSQTFRRPVAVQAPQASQASQAFARLRRDNPYPAMFFLNLGAGELLFGASPDVQVRADAHWVETAPVCGTFGRGADPIDDYEQAKGLMLSEVDAAAIAVCADSDRNDKAHVCVPGSVELLAHRRLHFFATIIHAIDHTRGRRRPGVDAFDIVLAHATPATVTGMPKAAARTLIEDLEACWRGWYAGAAVRLGADGGCQALTLLRSARLLDGVAEVRTGGNLLADSEPLREEEETRLKAQTLFRVLAGESAQARTAPPAGAAVRVQFEDVGDALAGLAREALVQAGCTLTDDAPIRVLGDGPLAALHARLESSPDDTRPLLALNAAALAVLGRAGARVEPLDAPQFARALACEALPGGPLQALGHFQAGLYTAHRIDATQLPAGWQLAARGADGRVVAACEPRRRIMALLFRPDAALSLRHRAGPQTLVQALHWLVHTMPPLCNTVNPHA